MKRLAGVFAVLLLVSCAPKTKQSVLRNQMPWPQLKLALEVSVNHSLGFGAPIKGNRVLTVDHLRSGVQAYWRGQNQRGQLTWMRSFTGLPKSDEDVQYTLKDLALFSVLKGAESPHLQPIEISPNPPQIGEEVYWPTHTQRGNIGYVRGWVIAVEKRHIQLDGWFHPGTSGAPILRADGTLVGIGYAGTNWSCMTLWGKFQDAPLKEQLECLFKKSFFTPGILAARVDGFR